VGGLIPALLIGTLVGCLFLGALWAGLGFFPDPLAQPDRPWTTRLTDRQGFTLRKLPGQSGYREYRPLNEFSPRLIAAVLAAEDHRFYQHLGLDPLALLRAALRDLRAGALVSGGSTITMQLARLTQGLTPGPRSFSRKLQEAWLALLIERLHSKDEILAAYLNAVPTGPQRWGLATAAQDYLGKDAQNLSPAEAAFLAALPKTPTLAKADRLAKRQAWILQRLRRNGSLSQADLERAQQEVPRWRPRANPHQAPHFLAFVQKSQTLARDADAPDSRPLAPTPRGASPDLIGQPAIFPGAGSRIRTTLDLEIQREVETLVAETVQSFSPQGLTQAAVVVMSLPSREILAWVGSADFFDDQEGQNDGVLALRQPGSALKPFIYQLALDQGLITAATILEDQPVDFAGPTGSFAPRNYGGVYHGRIPARQALASSLNVPAVRLAQALGPGRILARLRLLGLDSLKKDSDYYGLGLALGNGEVSLLALTNAYAALALGGLGGEPTVLPQSGPQPLAPRLDPASSFIISHILADDRARALGFGQGGPLATPYQASAKTGTSQNFRDNWCLGYTDRFVIGVWAGNFQAQPMRDVSGITGAGGLWRRIADFLAARQPPRPLTPPPGVIRAAVCPETGWLKSPACPNGVEEFFLKSQPLPEPSRTSDPTRSPDPTHSPGLNLANGPARPLRLLSPQSQEVYALDPGLDPSYQRLTAVAQVGPGVQELEWFLNGQSLGRQPATPLTRRLTPLSRGPQRLQALGFQGQKLVAQAEARFLVK
jgi:penicillin-binding protein 1C